MEFDSNIKVIRPTSVVPTHINHHARSFLDYVGRWGEYEEYDKLKVEDEQSFITALRDVSDIHQSNLNAKLTFFVQFVTCVSPVSSGAVVNEKYNWKANLRHRHTSRQCGSNQSSLVLYLVGTLNYYL